ncbi:hypothetical protein K4K49_003586 [Colletotrichum sp. SAR 10_70]|nr:hypothetical protein K4K50_002815 [Colletotrichum sp. SAR 10_71]KAI8172223.1 hypothetical protein K4K49_003586 [Colletotrichum sp. SAR 10_70]
MCPTNSNEALCGKPVDSYQDGMKVYFCRATKGRIVWALATARLSLSELSQLLRPVTMWFTAGQGEVSDFSEVLTFFGALRRLCHLSHERLDMFIPAWIKMVIRLAETMDKCARFRGSRDGMIPPEDEVLAEWEAHPERAYVWLKFVNRERKQAKKAAKDAGEYEAGNHENAYRRMRPKSAVQQQQAPRDAPAQQREPQRLGAVSVVSTIATGCSAEPRKKLRIARIVNLAKDEVKGRNINSEEAQREAELQIIRAMSPSIGRWMDKMEAKKLWHEAVKALEEARNSGGLEASPQELARLQAQVDETHAAYQAFKAGAREAGQSVAGGQQRRFSSAHQAGLHRNHDGDTLAAEQSESAAHPLDQFTTLALSLSTTPDLPQPRDLLLCFHDGYSPLPETTIHVTRDSVYRTRYPHPSIPARPWGAVRLDTPIRLYHDVCPPDSDHAGDEEGGDGCNKDRHNLDNSSNTPTHGTPSGARWFSGRTLVMLAVIVVAVAVFVAVLAVNVPEPAEFRLPIHLPIVNLLQSFEPLAIRQPSPHTDILAEFIDSANRVCHEPRILYRDDEWLDSRTAGLATVLNATARWRLGQACEHVNRDLTEARRGLSEVGSAISSGTTLLLLIAMGLKTTAEGWTSPERLASSERSVPHAPPPSSSMSLEEETLAGFREWVGHLAPEVSSKLDTAAFEAQTSILNSITSVYTGLAAFAVRLRRVGRSVDLDLLPLFPAYMVDVEAQSATFEATESQLLAPLQRGSKQRDALEQSIRDIGSYVCRLGNALQAVEDMTMVLLIIIVTANPGMAAAAATNGHRFSNSSALDGWNRTIQHLPDAILSAAYSSRRGCARDGDMFGTHDDSAGGRDMGLVEGGADRTTGGTAAITRRRIVMPPQPTHPGRRSLLEEVLGQKFRFRFSHPDPDEMSRSLSYAIADLKQRQARLHEAQQHDKDERNAKLEEENRAREYRVEEFYKALDSAESAADPASGSAGAGWLAGLWSYAGLGKDSDGFDPVAGTGDATAARPGGHDGDSTVQREARRFALEYGRAWRAFSADQRREMRSEVRDASLLGTILMRKQMELLRQV